MTAEYVFERLLWIIAAALQMGLAVGLGLRFVEHRHFMDGVLAALWGLNAFLSTLVLATL